MKKFGVLILCILAAGLLGGCKDKEAALDSAAPPPGPDANLKPITKAPGDHGAKPPIFPGPRK